MSFITPKCSAKLMLGIVLYLFVSLGPLLASSMVDESHFGKDIAKGEMYG